MSSTCAFEDKAATVGDTFWLAQQSLNGPVDAAPLNVQALNCSASGIEPLLHAESDAQYVQNAFSGLDHSLRSRPASRGRALA